jgi:DNA-binding NarL/FixJ family response regulator
MQSQKPLISVLLVDDQKFVGTAVERLLAGEEDIQLHQCDKALEAVDRANQIRPTVILQDLVLPDIDGVTMVRLFRANPTTASTAIIVLSGNDDAATRSRAAAAGADDFIVKLPARDELVRCIRHHAAGTRAIGQDVVTAPPEAGATSAREVEQTLDRRVMAMYWEPDDEELPDFLIGLIDRFIEEAEKHVEMLRDAGRRKDADALTATAHSLKGSSMTMGANKLAALCGRMETDGKRDPSMLFTPDLMTEVDRELVNVRHALTLERQGGRQR